MERFRIMEFDYVLMKETLKYADEWQMLQQSLASKRSRIVMREFKKPIKYLWVNFQENDCVINVCFSNEREVYWRIKSSRFVLKNAETTDIFELDGLKVESKRSQRRDKYVINSYCENDVVVCQRLVEVMLDVWIPKRLNYYISRVQDISHILNFEKLNQMNHLTFIVYFPISDREFHLFREKIHSKNSICFNLVYYQNLNHGCRIPLDCQKLEICSSGWLNREDLLNIKSKSVFLKKTILRNEDLNALLKQWLEERDLKLETAKIQISDGNLNEILNGIVAKDLDEIKKERKLINKVFEFLDFEEYEFKGYEGRHLVKSDGKIATAHLKSDIFRFIVWNESNPVITDVKSISNEMK
ncbi:hypothetical protein B9Z55_016389 [Caenorhabditis nigoni]|nr:hypothetical protein B9Z55_016389 [Caenorhabditis nigoni]